MNVILSIHPKWAKLIYEGKKTIEWRKTIPSCLLPVHLDHKHVFIKGILRSLYKALANWAKSERYTEATWHGDEHREELWAKVQDKCLKKAEEYK